MDQSEQHTGHQEGPSTNRHRGWIASGALVGTGLLAGAILAGTVSANAADGASSASAMPAAATATESTPSNSESDGPGHGWWGWWHGDGDGDGGASVSDDTAAKVKDAVLAQYPNATIRWIRSDSDGGYHAYVDTADGKDLDVQLNDAFAITGTDDLPDADGPGRGGFGWAGHGWGGSCADD